MTQTELLTKTDTDTLMIAALTLDAISDRTQEQRMALAWTMDEIERRHPEITPALDAWVESMDETFTYTEVAIAAIKAA